MSELRAAKRKWLVRPRPGDANLSVEVEGVDHLGVKSASRVIVEKPLTLFLNRREVVTMMTIGDHPELLALGYLVNQNMLKAGDTVDAVEFDADLGVVVVRTPHETDFETKLAKKIRTSGCAQGTVFGDVIDAFGQVRLPAAARLKTSWLYELTRRINTEPSLYLAAGAVHGCVLCEEDRPLVYMEDVGRHNAVDKVAGWMFMNREPAANKIFYTTGRLTSEMVIKTAMMGVPILISRSGFTAWGVELARQVGLTLIGRARGKRFLALAGAERIVFDADATSVADEDGRHRRKGASDD